MTFSSALPKARGLWCIALAFALCTSLLLASPAAPAQISFGEQIDKELIEDYLEAPSKLVSVVVGKLRGSDRSLEETVVKTGGTVGRSLPVINGFSATVPASSIEDLAANPNLRSLSKNRFGKFETFTYDDTTLGMNSNPPRAINALPLWSKGNYGSGVGVALIDTGVSPMNDLTKASGYRIVHGPDLSGENNLIDSYGHGTVMAGIIAGDGHDSRSTPGGAFVGSAPRAWIVSVKVAGANGVTDVSTVLAAMHWVAAYRDQFNIRVLNLSWGTPSTQSYLYDPLNYAVERLWALGITVVVSAGNSGPSAGTIAKPADDPFVISVGAYNTNQNTDLSDDTVPGWSSRGPTAANGIAKPDLVAPGRLIVATRSFGSTVEKTYPKALTSPSYIRGSGTSQAAAVVSGAAALLIREKPHLSPAQVKYALKSTARPIPGTDSSIQGAGRMDVTAAATSTDEGYADLNVTPSNGLGSLEASRGGHNVQTDCNGDGTPEPIKGELTAQCQNWDGVSWTGVSWTGDAWTGVSWTGGSWSGVSWTGGSWSGVSWTGVSWTGGSWSGVSWTNNDYTGGSWNGVSWTGVSWTGVSWTGVSWTGGSWTGVSWTGVSWTGVSWTGVSWTGVSWTTGMYEDWTTGNYDEFLTAFWGNNPPRGKRLIGEAPESTPQLSLR